MNLDIDLEALSRRQRDTGLFAVVALGIIDSLSAGALTPTDAIKAFFHAKNCRFVRSKLRDKRADEVMGRGVQLADLFDAMPVEEAHREFQHELQAMKVLCISEDPDRPTIATFIGLHALGVDDGDIMAWLGPAIGPAAYEVGADVRDAFVGREPSALPRFAPNARGRWQADLYGLARDALTAAGVGAVYGGGSCTFSEPERFFSHRRQAPCGRMATLIWLQARG